MPTPRRISDFKPVLTNLAYTSHYQVIFGGLSDQLRGYLSERSVDARFISETFGLLCNSASLPGSSFNTVDITGNFTGVSESFVHTKLYTPIDLEFYVDKNYKSLKLLEHWMEFISSGSNSNPTRAGYFYRMQYPAYYKTDQTKIVKFDRDYNSEIEYTFYGLYPKSLNFLQIGYDYSDILKVTASFNYDRYVCGKTTSFDYYNGNDNNKENDPQTNVDNKKGQEILYSYSEDYSNFYGVVNNPSINDFGAYDYGSELNKQTITPSRAYDSSFRIG